MPLICAVAMVYTSQSWSGGLQWQDLLLRGNALGLAVGQPTFATRLHGDGRPDHGKDAWEGRYRFQLSDHLSVTPAVFSLSRPLGADTLTGASFRPLGALVKTSLRF